MILSFDEIEGTLNLYLNVSLRNVSHLEGWTARVIKCSFVVVETLNKLSLICLWIFLHFFRTLSR